MSEPTQPAVLGATERHIRFVDQLSADQAALMHFVDPLPRYAVEVMPGALTTGEDTLRVTVVPFTAPPLNAKSPVTSGNALDPKARCPLLIKAEAFEVTWLPNHAVLRCEPLQTEPLLLAIVEFTFYEAELTKLEQEIASTWQELEQDKSLAFEVTKADLARGAVIGSRMHRVLERRIRHARIEPHHEPDPGLSAAGRKLGRLLREKAHNETRLETVGNQLEVFEDIYEMGSQRLGEFRASSQEHTLEWVIIVLLAAETLLMAAQAFWHFGA